MTNEQTETQAENPVKGQKPVHKIRVGSIQVAIWETEGLNGIFPTASFSRSYRTLKEGWKSGYTYAFSHLEDLQNAAELAKLYMTRHYPQAMEKEEIAS